MDERPRQAPQPTAVRAPERRDLHDARAATLSAHEAARQRSLVIASLLRCPEHVDEVGGG